MYIDIEKIETTRTPEGDTHEEVAKYDKVFLAKVCSQAVQETGRPSMHRSNVQGQTRMMILACRAALPGASAATISPASSSAAWCRRALGQLRFGS